VRDLWVALVNVLLNYSRLFFSARSLPVISSLLVKLQLQTAAARVSPLAENRKRTRLAIAQPIDKVKVLVYELSILSHARCVSSNLESSFREERRGRFYASPPAPTAIPFPATLRGAPHVKT